MCAIVQKGQMTGAPSASTSSTSTSQATAGRPRPEKTRPPLSQVRFQPSVGENSSERAMKPSTVNASSPNIPHSTPSNGTSFQRLSPMSVWQPCAVQAVLAPAPSNWRWMTHVQVEASRPPKMTTFRPSSILRECGQPTIFSCFS